MDDGDSPVAAEIREEIAEEIAQEKLKENLENELGGTSSGTEIRKEIAAEIVEEKVKETLEKNVENEVSEHSRNPSAASVGAEIRKEIAAEIVEEKVKETLEKNVENEVSEHSGNPSAASSGAEIRKEIAAEIVEEKVKETLEKNVENEVSEHSGNPSAASSGAEIRKEIAAEIVEETMQANAEKEHSRKASAASSRSGQAGSSHQVQPPPYSKEDPVHAGVDAKHEEEERRKPEDGTRWKSVMCSLIICMGSFSFGTIIGYPSPAVLNIDNHPNPFHLSQNDQSWVGSIITLLALFGGLLGGPCMDILGRKASIIVWTVPCAISWIIIVASPSSGCMLAGRALGGLCTGIFSVIIPVYIGEIAPPSIRGLLGSCHQMAVCLGILFIYCFGAFLSWTWAAISCEVCVMILAVGLLFIPESPRWLLSVKRKEETEKALRWLRGDAVDLKWEMLELEDAIRLSQDKASLREFLQPQLYKPLLISLGLMLFQQFSGINVIMFYAGSIFEMAGMDLDPNVETIIVGAVGVLGTLVSVFIADLAGRRVLLLISGTMMTLSIGGMGAFFYEKENLGNEDYALSTLGWLPVTALVVFNFGFNVAFGPIPWLMMSEIFPLRAKALASSTATACNWLFAFILTKFWSDMTVTMTVAGGYWFCTAFCALSIPFVIFCVPETKGRTLEDIVSSFK